VMAVELRASGVDFSFAPVLDLQAGCEVIGDRAFHRSPEAVAELARAFANGMADGGMAAVGKHFPGHGHVSEDSHITLPRDQRDLETVRLSDMLVFTRLVHYGIPAMMTGHLVFMAIDPHPAGFSDFWVKQVLRSELGFQGAVFCDDLTMGAVQDAGGLAGGITAALEAGTDMALICRDDSDPALLDIALPYTDAVRGSRLMPMQGKDRIPWVDLVQSPRYRQQVAIVQAVNGESQNGEPQNGILVGN